jgi:hypothetical protein
VLVKDWQRITPLIACSAVGKIDTSYDQIILTRISGDQAVPQTDF